MNIRECLFTTLAVVMPFVAAAQEPSPDSIGVVRAATEYYRDVRLKGPIVIDQKLPYFHGPVVGAGVIDEAAKTPRTTKGRLSEHIVCADSISGRRKRSVCVMPRGHVGAVVTYTDLVIRNDTAKLDVVYHRVGANRSVEYGEEALTLVRTAGGQWKVERVDERGVS